jgi:uncharacterized protein (TIGR02996 family)
MAKKRKQEANPTADRSELRRLLEAAKADHYDDGPRLALADWLEEHGGEVDRARAEIIRLQLDTASGGPDWALSVERLRQKFVREWVATHFDFFRRKLPGCERGLLVAEAAVRAWLSGEVDNAWAWVESARIQAIDARDVAPLLASARMAMVSRLDFAGLGMGVVSVRAAAGAPRGGPLRSLRLMTYAHNLPDLAGHLRPGLDELDLTLEGPGPRDWARLFASPGVEGLRRLHLGISHLSDDDAALLAESPGLRGLRTLSLDRPALTAAGLAILAGLPLTRLAINEVPLGALASLNGSACGESLTELHVLNSQKGPWPAGLMLPRLRRLTISEGGLSIGAANLPAGLDELDVSRNPFGPEGTAALADGPGPRALRLGGCSIGDAGLARLASWPGLARVRVLDLTENGLTDASLRALAASPHAVALEALFLAGNGKITAAGVEAFLRSGLGGRLRWLGLAFVRATSVADAAPQGLRELRLGGYNVAALGNRGLARLRSAMPDCAIG